MKHFILLLLLTGLFSSCKKTTDADLGSIERDMKFEKKLKSFSKQSGFSMQMDYNPDGNLKLISDNFNRKISFTYSPDFALTYQYPGTNYELKNTSRNQLGRVAKAELWMNAVLTDKNEYTYNQEGYLIKKKEEKVLSGVTYITEYNYENGNLIASKSFKDGAITYSHEFSYYTDKLNKFNLDIYDQFEHKYMAGAFFGRLNRNLLKSWSFTSFPSNTSHSSQYSYTLDADGYPAKLNQVNDGNSSETNFVFQ